MHTRKAEFGAVDLKARSIPVVIATDYPVDRYDFVEVLDITAADLSRAPLPLIESHDMSRVNIGLVKDIRPDGNKLRGTAVFGVSQRANELLADAQAGIVCNVSIGYSLKGQGTPIQVNGQPARKFPFTPHEVSIVGVPADPTAGFNRSHQSGITIMETENITVTDNAGERGLAKLERDRVVAIGALSRQFGQWRDENLDNTAVSEGWSLERYQAALLKRMESGATDVTRGTPPRHGGSGPDYSKFSLRNVILAQMEPAKYGHLIGFEREMSEEVARSSAQQSAGLYIPRGVLVRDFATGLNGGSNVIQTTVAGELLADALRASPQVAQAGARMLVGLRDNLTIPRITTGSSVAAVAEQGAAAETDVTVGSLTLSPKRISAFVDVSRQELIQSTVQVEQMLQADLLRSSNAQLDNYAINGTGTAPEPRGIRNTSGIGAVAGGANGAQIAWSHIVDLEAAAANSNAVESRPGYMINTKSRAWLRKTFRGTNLDYIFDGKTKDASGRDLLNGSPAFVGNNVPSNLTKGTATGICSSLIYCADWTELLIGIWGGLDVVVDPYTFAGTGTVRITLNQYVDVGIRQPAAFAVMNDALTA